MKTTNQPRRAAIYARVSTDKQDERSVDDQERKCRDYAKAHGYSIEVVERDAGVSGAHLKRDGIQALISLAMRRGGSPFDALLVDDLSRLSRDLGQAWRLIFEDLVAVGVRVIDCSTGMASDAAGARLTFGAMALVNDTFLQLVKAETHRGLEGRAIAGFWTGGRVFGYSTVTESNPPDPEHPRKVPVINDREAVVVRKIFGWYRDGYGLKQIAAKLNEEGLQAPYDRRSKLKTIGHGWPHSTIRAMLRNERYIGIFTWNRRQFMRVGNRKNRRPRFRPESEVTRTVREELRIIDQHLWDAVHARIARRKPHDNGRSGRPPGTGKRVYLLGGLARCSTCDGGMSVVGAQMKDGVRYVQFGCSRHASRGASICANGLTISEKRLTEAVLGALKAKLVKSGAATRFHEFLLKQLALAQKGPADDDGRALDREISVAEQQVKNVTKAIAQLGLDDDLTKQLDEERRRLQLLRDRRATTVTREDRSKVVPHPTVIDKYLKRFIAVLGTASVEGRQLLERHLDDVVLTPVGEGKERHYHATTAFKISVCLMRQTGWPMARNDNVEPQNASTPDSCEAEVEGKACCGGRI
ncbi:MAG: recombinase family protein [Myxococcales bacterium]|nr:recombinase family protein [Myxococcales bacterium]